MVIFLYRNSFLKQTVIFIIGSLVNFGLFCLSKYAHFPVWADYAGSVYITALSGATLGALSVILHTVLLVLLIDGWYSLWYGLCALIICAVVFYFRKTEQPFDLKHICAIGSVSAFFNFFIQWLKFATSGAHGRYSWVADVVSGKFLCASASAGTAFLECLLTLVIFYILFLITPKTDEKLVFKR